MVSPVYAVAITSTVLEIEDVSSIDCPRDNVSPKLGLLIWPEFISDVDVFVDGIVFNKVLH